MVRSMKISRNPNILPLHSDSGLRVQSRSQRFLKNRERKPDATPTIIGRQFHLAGDPVMRLTMRTLLAYLDDTLEPTEAKLIGEKVAESETAQELVARIKLVTRRRRLTTPPATGPGARLDANTVAEYLDNKLDAEQVTEVEETCIGSDAHLADVAACHQVLTLVLGEPVLVPPTARQRMYALNRGPESLPKRKARAPAGGRGSLPDIELQPDEADETLLLGLPLYRESGLVRWLAPVVTACLLAAASVAVWMALRYSTPGVAPFGASQPDSLAMTQPASRPPEKPTTEQPPSGPPAKTAEPGDQKVAEPVKTPADANHAEAASAKVEPEKKMEPAPSPEKGGEPVKKPSVPPPSLEKPPIPLPAPVRANAPSPDRIEVGQAAWTAPCVLVQRLEDKGAWQVVPQKKSIYSTDTLLSMPGYRADLTFSSDVALSLWGIVPEMSRVPTPVLESSVVIFANKAVDLDFKLERGRVIIANKKKKGPALVKLRFLNEVWELTLPDNSSEVVAELFGEIQPLGPDPAAGEPGLYTRVFALKGSIKLHAGKKDYAMASPSLFDWDSTFGTADKPRALPRAPDWWTNREAPKTNAAPATKAALSSLSTRLTSKNKLDVVLAEALSDSNLYNRIAALRCRAALDELSVLLDALADDRHAEMRLRAIEELQHLLGLSRTYDDKLKVVLKEKNYTDNQAITIINLLHPISAEQWADSGVRTQLVTLLLSDKLAIRQLTYSMLTAVSSEGRNIPYDPAGDSLQRDRAYEEWKQVVSHIKAPAKKG
jgi:hypothetical protein